MNETGQNAPAVPTQNNGTKNLTPFPKGVCPNPGGRPKTKHISEALREELDSLAPDGEVTNAQAIARRLVKTARDAKRDSQSTQAAEVIADRIEGKPTQAVHLEQGMDENTMKIIANLAARLLDGDGSASVSTFPAFQPPIMEHKALPDVTQCTTLDAETTT